MSYSVFKIALRGWGYLLTGEMGGEFICDGVNLRRSDFDHSNFY